MKFEDGRLIETIIEGAKSYIVNYTGQTIEDLYNQEDVVIAVLVLVGEFYDNRTVAVDNRLNLRVNSMLEGLLGRRSVNLL